jgi:hypothetical protein
MSYFRELPDLYYQSSLPHKNSSKEYVRVKNLFRRVKLLDWLQDKATLFNKYQIEEGERPDIVSEKLYGSADYDWVVLLTANIINVRDQWPLSNRDLYVYAENKYTIQNLSSIHHYETIEVKDSKGRLILPKGQIVDSNFKITVSSGATYKGVGAYETTIFAPDTTGEINPVIGVTNYEYESKLNEEKRQIYVLREGYLQQFLNDMREIMHYDRSSQYIDRKLIRTENTRIIGP